MATPTTNYSLKKPDTNDYYNVADQNGNMDAIDSQMKANANAAAAAQSSANGKQGPLTAGTDYLAPSGDGSNLTETFTADSTKEDILTGDTNATIFGKIKKWFASFGGAAWLNTGVTSGTVATGNHNHFGVYEPVITIKSTAFNVDFDTMATDIKMNGTQSVGSLGTVAKADHVHPTDTSRVAQSDFIAHQVDDVHHVNYGPESGATNAYVVTLSPIPTAWVSGMVISFKAANSNTGASTIAITGLTGTKSITKNVSSALVSGDILAGQIVDVEYDGAYCQIVPVNVLPASTTTPGAVKTAVTPSSGSPIAIISNPLSAASQLVSGPLAPTILAPSGLTGATAASRYAGATTSGSPTSGTFAVGDFVIDQKGIVWICTVAGTPGTWSIPASYPYNYVPIGTVTLDVDSASIDFTGISTNFRMLRLDLDSLFAVSNQGFNMQFNGDTGSSNYNCVTIGTSSINSSEGPSIYASSCLNTTATPGEQIEITISERVTANGKGVSMKSKGYLTLETEGVWKNITSRITSIHMYAGGAANLKAGATATLWGAL